MKNIAPLRPRVWVHYESAKTPTAHGPRLHSHLFRPHRADDGHRFTNPNVNFGGEHFGMGYRCNPTYVTYHWLVDPGSGNLVRGPAVSVATPAFTFLPARSWRSRPS